MLIKIIKGNYGHQNGISVDVKKPSDVPFDVSDEEALRLVKLGIAKITQDHRAVDSESDMPSFNGNNGNKSDESDRGLSANGKDENAEFDSGENIFAETDSGAPLYNADSTNAELQAIAKEYGIDIPPRANKAQLIALLDDYFGDVPALSAKEPEI